MNQRFTYILRFVVGLVFLLSGLLKAIKASVFADLMSEYGAVWFGVAAPLIIGIEILLAVLLIFNIRPRKMAAATAAFILFVSAVYLYGVLARGITDCGCFGPLTWLNSKPWLTFTRNAVLLTMLVPSLVKPQQGTSLTMTNVVFMAFVAVVLMYMCGWSMHGAKCLQKRSKKFEPVALSEHQLGEIISTSPDSTYFVFAFSYGCPYCQNSVANVSQYKSMGVVDKVIGVAVRNPEGRERFDRLFHADFEILEISEMQMMRLTSTLPTVYRIRHDSIVSTYSDLVITPALLLP